MPSSTLLALILLAGGALGAFITSDLATAPQCHACTYRDVQMSPIVHTYSKSRITCAYADGIFCTYNSMTGDFSSGSHEDLCSPDLWPTNYLCKTNVHGIPLAIQGINSTQITCGYKNSHGTAYCYYSPLNGLPTEDSHAACGNSIPCPY